MNALKRFSEYSYNELLELIPKHKEYKEFNTLGLYRSLFENENLSTSEKVSLRELAHSFFQKAFDFLQLKDPSTYVKVLTLGENPTTGDLKKIWNQIITNQQIILKDKRIKHRNFGVYSKHNCGHSTCPYNGLMIKQGSYLEEQNMCFWSDKNSNNPKQKSLRFKKERKQFNQARALGE